MFELAKKYLQEYIDSGYKDVHDLKTANEYEEKIEWNRYLFDDDLAPYVDDAIDKLHDIKTSLYTKMYEHYDNLKDSEKLACLIWLDKDSHTLQDEIINRFNENESIDYRLKVAYWFNHQDEVSKPSKVENIEYDEDTLEEMYYGFKHPYDSYDIEDYGYIEYDGVYFNRDLEVNGKWINIKWTINEVYPGWTLKMALEKEEKNI